MSRFDERIGGFTHPPKSGRPDVSKQIPQHYSHIQMQANREALESVVTGGNFRKAAQEKFKIPESPS
jgi:hypothetical protein